MARPLLWKLIQWAFFPTEIAGISADVGGPSPTALMQSVKHYKVLHEHDVILAIETKRAPRVQAAEWVSMESVGQTFTHGTSR